MYICTNTPIYSLFDAQKNADIDWRILELYKFYVGGYQAQENLSQ
jgi:hypothetical protein